MSARSFLAIVLAAGEGTRMRSSKPKVLHAIASRPMVAHVLDAVRSAGASAVAVVVGPDSDAVADEARRTAPGAQIFVQRERRGTAHAVLAAKDALARGADDILIVFGDTPLIRPQSVSKFREALARGADLVVSGFRPADPTGYGRLVTENGKLIAIREERDASAEEKAITLCNGGLMAFSGKHALTLLEKIDDNNAKKEFYLTDAAGLAHRAGLNAQVIEIGEDEVHGVDNRMKLARGEAMMQDRLREAAMASGVTLVAPETVFLAADTKLGSDVTIEPFVVFGPGVTVGDKAVIRSFSHLDGVTVGEGAAVGPYARLRPGTVLGKGVKIGNFVETKAATIEDGAKVNHLSYVGDARVGEKANVGAGTITCNYDGQKKHHTDIGKGAFIGSNSALVAPVKIGDGAYIGSGSVITQDVPAGSLAVARGRQAIKQGWALTLRTLMDKGHKS
jgi:bifunctional UDP-N-acetylglucosamine pyrophosphorylase/glucosamine-1-phosphate N-acetyltransferase